MTNRAGALTIHDRRPVTLTVGTVTTPFGVLHVATDAGGVPCFISPAAAGVFRATLRRCGWPHVAIGLSAAVPRIIHQALAGPLPAGPVNLAGLTPFQRQVLMAVCGIARGITQTYGDIAQQIGHAGAARAVGTALARNPLPFLIPCHRVVAAGGRLGGYAAGGPVMKRRLLVAEGAGVATWRD